MVYIGGMIIHWLQCWPCSMLYLIILLVDQTRLFCKLWSWHNGYSSTVDYVSVEMAANTTEVPVNFGPWFDHNRRFVSWKERLYIQWLPACVWVGALSYQGSWCGNYIELLPWYALYKCHMHSFWLVCNGWERLRHTYHRPPLACAITSNF